MCGRFALTAPASDIAEIFQVDILPEVLPRYNVAPTTQVACVVDTDEGRKVEMFRWGLIPSWAKDKKVGYRMINARAETVAEKPSFRSSFKAKRCLVPCDGFYEWVAGENGKTPHYIRMRDSGLFAFAGLWSEWKGGEGSLNTYTIITTEANEFLKPLHHRMPVILPPDLYTRWLDPQTPALDLHAMLKPLTEDSLEYFAVTKTVNSPRNDSAECIEPLGT